MNDDHEKRQREIDEAWEAHAASPLCKKQWLTERLEEQGGLCFYCRVEIFLPPRGDATIDHVIPLSRGGEDAIDNCVAACKLCNSAKADLMPEEVKTLLPDRRAQILKRREKREAWRGRYSFKSP